MSNYDGALAGRWTCMTATFSFCPTWRSGSVPGDTDGSTENTGPENAGKDTA